MKFKSLEKKVSSFSFVFGLLFLVASTNSLGSHMSEERNYVREIKKEQKIQNKTITVLMPERNKDENYLGRINETIYRRNADGRIERVENGEVVYTFPNEEDNVFPKVISGLKEGDIGRIGSTLYRKNDEGVIESVENDEVVYRLLKKGEGYWGDDDYRVNEEGKIKEVKKYED